LIPRLQPGQSFPFNLYPWIALAVIATAWIFASLKGKVAEVAYPRAAAAFHYARAIL